MHHALAHIARPDTFLGVCEAIGTDLGINPQWLRLAWAVPLFLSRMFAAAAYLGLAVLVIASRWLFPVEAIVTKRIAAVTPPAAENDAEGIVYAAAA